MTNPTLASLLPFLLVWMAYRAHWQRHSCLAKPLPALGIAILCSVFWTIRNHRVFHGVISFRSVLGLQLWMSNNDQYRDSFPSWLHPIDNTVECATYVRMSEVTYVEEKRQEALHLILSHPRREMQMSLRRFVAAWTGLEHPVEKFVRTDSLLARIVLAFNSLGGVGALAGEILLYRRRSAFVFPLAVFSPVFPCVVYVAQLLLRYRHPIDPIILLLTAVALETVVESFVLRGPSALSKSIGTASHSGLARP